MPDHKTQPPVGIDLGTTFSAVAYLDADGRPETIRNSEGDLTTPSAVFFDQKRPIVGMEAVEAGLLEPDRLAQFAKRNVGEQHYEKSIRGKHLPAEVIQALVLRKLKTDAELKLGRITEAVITVPAFFNEPCRKATQDAGRLAGLDVLDIINEPTAAAITYGVQQGFLGTARDGEPLTSRGRELVLVYDLGGGTFDVTVMEIEKGNFNTIATAGDVYLGGIDWDNRMVDLIAEAFLAQHGHDPREDPQAEQELLRKANQTKHALTQRESVTVAFASDGRRLRTEISQQAFSERCVDLVERTIMTVHLVLDDAGIDWPDLTRLILVGGSTRMPMIRDELQQLSGMELDRSLSPDEAVSHGAALYAGMLSAGAKDKTGISVTNVNSHDLGVLAVDPKSNKPRRKIMIPRNSKLPARKTVRFRTHVNNQANVKIQIVEGGDKRGINATPIGKCVVADLPKGTPKGTNVDVRFDYRADGRLTVHASLPEIDRKITMTLNRAAGLSDDEIGTWTKRLDEGLSDAMLAGMVEGDDGPADDSVSDSGDVLPDDGPAAEDAAAEVQGSVQGFAALQHVEFEPAAPATPVASAPATPVASAGAAAGAAAVLGVSASKTPHSPTPSAPNPQSPNIQASGSPASGGPAPTDPARTADAVREPTPKFSVGVGDAIKIETDQASAPAAKLSSGDAQSLAAATGSAKPTISEKPQLALDPKDAVPAVKADANDLAMLAALSGKAPAPKKGDVPLIVTDHPSGNDGANKAAEIKPAPKPKKSGGLFGRKRK
ncbi:Chaperone protein DnaK [Stieleria maiorica]|uniref:Chaperone protein DnaK n=1 Tax=Stieleria maiorica TaxID=2795974 RepID=A0A5B9M9U5_9BACT|nr:Hsp70 family protein [Stieleria maiorica]QEF98061.1 Chaperone protein DnaK [Stieleria maiorica]